MEIQAASDMGDSRTMYKKIKVALGPTISKCAPIKSESGESITDQKKQLNRWVEHYSKLYSKESPANAGQHVLSWYQRLYQHSQQCMNLTWNLQRKNLQR